MKNIHMSLSQELTWRGMINQTTFSDISILDQEKRTFYHGFDASAPSQTVGNLAAMMVDLVFLRHGYTGIILKGGATSLIGDPGGKDKERPMQSIETIQENIKLAETQIQKIYGKHQVKIVNNLDWMKDVSILEFLRDVGKHYTVGDMIKKEYIKDRIHGEGISYTEFSYALLQGYDYLYLFDTYGCTLQIGGSDQWTNCLSGVELVRRKRGQEVHVLTLPLVVNKVTGKKFGKSEQGAVWLDKNMTSPYEFYQFWKNVDDESVLEYLKIFTDIQKDEYDALIDEFHKDKKTRIAQKYLAYEVTKLVHGKQEADEAVETSNMLFENKTLGTHANIQEVHIQNQYIKDNTYTMIDLLVGEKVLSSKREARDMIEQGGVYIDEEKILEQIIDLPTKGSIQTLRIGKKKYYKLIY